MKIYNVLDGGAIVIGPILLDRYIKCDVNRIDQTSPAPVGKVISTHECPGGAGNVVANLCAMGVPSSILSVVGNDDTADVLKKLLTSADIEQQIYVAHDASTSIKTRLVDSRNQIFCRFDDEEVCDANTNVDAVLIPALEKLVAKYASKVLILSDYAKGVITPLLARRAIEIAHELGIPSIVDPVPSHQIWYEEATIITPNIDEARVMLGVSEEMDPIDMARELVDVVRCKNVLITAGSRGMYLVSATDEYAPQHFETSGNETVDTTGAGDTVVAGLAAALYEDLDIVSAVACARDAAEVVVHSQVQQ